jgi:hypothetical protein
VGREDRGRLPMCSRDPRVRARLSGGQLIEAPLDTTDTLAFLLEAVEPPAQMPPTDFIL